MGSVSPAGMDGSSFSASFSHSFASFIVCLMPGDEGMGKRGLLAFAGEGDYLGVFLCQLGLHEEGLLRLEEMAIFGEEEVLCFGG